MKAFIRVVGFFLVVAAITFAWIKFRPAKPQPTPAATSTTDAPPAPSPSTAAPAPSPRPAPAPAVPEVVEIAPETGPRTWTNRDGRTLKADYVSSTETTVTVRRSDNVMFTIPLTNLSPEDSDWVAEQPLSPKPATEIAK